MGTVCRDVLSKEASGQWEAGLRNQKVLFGLPASVDGTTNRLPPMISSPMALLPLGYTLLLEEGGGASPVGSRPGSPECEPVVPLTNQLRDPGWVKNRSLPQFPPNKRDNRKSVSSQGIWEHS